MKRGRKQHDPAAGPRSERRAAPGQRPTWPLAHPDADRCVSVSPREKVVRLLEKGAKAANIRRFMRTSSLLLTTVALALLPTFGDAAMVSLYGNDIAPRVAVA